MTVFSQINIITACMACIFFIPILVGIIMPLSGDRIHRSFTSLLNNIIFLASIILAIYLTRLIITGNFIYDIIPAFDRFVEDYEFWAYASTFIVLLLLIDGLLQLLTIPFHRYLFVSIANKISKAVSSMNGFSRRIIGGLWKLPKAVWLVLAFSILLSIYINFFNSSFITIYANSSAPYQLVQENVIKPLLDTGTVKNIQIILNKSFKTAENELSDVTGKYLVRYFNGITLNEAVQSNSEIDAKAREIVGTETDTRQQAYLLYLWIAENLTYDNDKAAVIADNPSAVSSGAVVAYNTRTGVCFDFACLYVAMCRAVDLNVRFITGLGYTGTEWGDHAWNQVYDTEEDIWINVDTTFGSSGVNYFDKAYFSTDHRNGAIQGEW